jgi:hypothetical protein
VGLIFWSSRELMSSPSCAVGLVEAYCFSISCRRSEISLTWTSAPMALGHTASPPFPADGSKHHVAILQSCHFRCHVRLGRRGRELLILDLLFGAHALRGEARMSSRSSAIRAGFGRPSPSESSPTSSRYLFTPASMASKYLWGPLAGDARGAKVLFGQLVEFGHVAERLAGFELVVDRIG